MVNELTSEFAVFAGTPAIYTMSAAKYHSDPAPTPSLSNSIANILITQSPKHAWLAHPRLGNAAKSESNIFDIGSAAHRMLLEKTNDGIVIVEADNWMTKAAKEARANARSNGQFPILARHYTRTQEMVSAARTFMLTTELGDILDSGLPERVLMWQEGETWCRSRLDLLSKDHQIIVDYKTTENAEPEAFIRQIARMGYDLQAEFYPRGVTAITGTEPRFVFLVQEVSPPYCCSLIALSNEYRVIGRTKFQRALESWQNNLANGVWPAYPGTILYAEPPAWAAVDWAEDEAETAEITSDE